MPEAMKKISKDLGKNAVILNSKVVYSGGFFGLFRKKNIEVIAAIDKWLESAVASEYRVAHRYVPSL